MKRVAWTILVVAGLLVACGPGTIEPGDLNGIDVTRDNANYIVGGSTYTGLPAVGAITYNGSMHCTGTLIGPRKVLTAAHCVKGYSASKFKFVIGPSISQAQYTLSVSATSYNPNYNSSSITNDIAYLTLSADAPVAPMGVVAKMDSSWVGKSLFFVGYGVNSGYNQTGAGTKRAVWMNISEVASTTFSYEDPGKNTCNGDSGGPAFAQDAAGNYLVAGVTSYGDYYCNQYGVDTRVDAYLSYLGVSGSDVNGGSSGGSGGSSGGSTDPCNGETYTGRCNGQTVVWCENNQVYTQDCAAEGKVCVFDTAKQYYACRAPATDPCNGETYTGRCDGNTVIWCENNQVKSINCANYGYKCGYNSSKGYYDCVK